MSKSQLCSLETSFTKLPFQPFHIQAAYHYLLCPTEYSISMWLRPTLKTLMCNGFRMSWQYNKEPQMRSLSPALYRYGQETCFQWKYLNQNYLWSYVTPCDFTKSTQQRELYCPPLCHRGELPVSVRLNKWEVNLVNQFTNGRLSVTISVPLAMSRVQLSLETKFSSY